MAEDPKQRDRTTGSQKKPAPERERTTGGTSAKSIADREREETSFVTGKERVTGSFSTPRASAPNAAERERVTQKYGEPRERTTGNVPVVPAAVREAITQPKQLTQHQKQMLSSAFQDAARMNHLKSVVGNTGERARDDDDDDEATAMGRSFDGEEPASELTGRDLFKTVQAPVQSREGRRNKNAYEQVLNQFAVGHNPRYEPDGPGKPRGHIFVWDVSRAMNCEVPHFIGMKELSYAQTVDWIRHEGPARGWNRANMEDAIAAAQAGQLVLALPKEVRLKQVAVVRPADPDPDGRPRLAAAAVKIGGNLSVYEALGVYAAEYFLHP